MEELTQTIFKGLAQLIAKYLSPALANGMVRGINKIESLFEKIVEKEPSLRKNIILLIKSLPNNVTNEMGLDLYRLTLFLDKNKYENIKEFVKDF